MINLGSLYTKIEADVSGLSKAETSIKSFSNNSSKSFDKVGMSVKNMVRNITAAVTATYGIRSVFDVFKYGLRTIEDFNITVASTAAFISTFANRTKDTDIASVYKKANDYAIKLNKSLEIMDAKTIASGRDLQVISESMIQNGVLLDLNNKKQVQGFQNIATALALVTQGQNKDIQMRQEINALLMGQIRMTDRLPKLLSNLDPALKDHLKLWKAEGTLIENVGNLLEGFSSQTGGINDLWITVGSTMETIYKRVLRGAIKPIFSDLIGLAKKLNSTLMDSEGNLTPFAKSIQNDIKNTYSIIKDFTSKYGQAIFELTELLVKVKVAQLLFNAAVKANPYLLVTSALVTLNQELKHYNVGLGEQDASLGKLKSSASDLLTTLKSIRSGSKLMYDPQSDRVFIEQLSEQETIIKRIDKLKSNIGNKKWYQFSIFKDPIAEKKYIKDVQSEIDTLQGKLAHLKDVAALKRAANLSIKIDVPDISKKTQKLQADYEALKDNIIRLNDEIKQNQLSGDDLIRSLKQSGMTGVNAWKDMKRQAAEYADSAKKALETFNTVEDAKLKSQAWDDFIAFTDKAKNKYADLGRTVEGVNKKVAINTAISGVEEMVKLKDQALKAQRDVQVKAFDAVADEAGFEKSNAFFNELKVKTNEFTMISFPAMGTALKTVWKDGGDSANLVFTNIRSQVDKTATKISEDLWVAPKNNMTFVLGNVEKDIKEKLQKPIKELSETTIKKDLYKNFEGVWTNVETKAGNSLTKIKSKMTEVVTEAERIAKVFEGLDVDVTVSQGRKFGGMISKLKEGGKVLKAQTGRYFPGFGGGDKIPILGEAGEYMINKFAVKGAGVDTARAFNQQNWPKVISNLFKKMSIGGPTSPSFSGPSLALANGGSTTINNNYSNNETVRNYYVQGSQEPISVRADEKNSTKLLNALKKTYINKRLR